MQLLTALIRNGKKILSPLFSTRAAGIYILLFATSIAIGTFIENDYGTSSAQKLVYKTTWFTILLILFCLTLIVNIVRFRMFQQRKWALFTFHVAFVVILIGAGVTRYFGFEGVMHIRENTTSSVFLSDETYLTIKILKNGRVYEVNEPVLFASLGSNEFRESYLLGNDLIEVDLKEFIPNPKEVIKSDPKGRPTIKIVFAGSQGREEYYLEQGQTKRIRNVVFNFNDQLIPGAVNIGYDNKDLKLIIDRVFVQTVMATQKTDTLFPNHEPYPLKLRSMYTDGLNSFVFGDFYESGILHLESEGQKVKSESLTALKFEVKINDALNETLVYGKKGMAGNPAVIETDKVSVALSYGAIEKQLPFAIKLYDFIMERYPGTNNPASYASEVQLIDSKNNLKENHRIYMNHILDYQGYRFFQSSYDNDEFGTYLSVNNDFFGTWISYSGYILLTLGMIFSLLSKKSRFYKLSQLIKDMRAKGMVVILVLLSSFLSSSVLAQTIIDQGNIQNIIDKDHADLFSRIVVQDQNGRMKPMHTLTREVMRKLIRKESFNGLSADQVILGMFVNSADWVDAPLIKLGKHEKLLKVLGTSKSVVSYKDFFGENGKYLLSEEMRKISGLAPRDRGVYEKELLKVDERVNIINMIFSGHIFKIIPVPGDTNNTWVSSHRSGHSHGHDNETVADKFFSTYRSSLKEAMISKDYSFCNTLINELSAYQTQKGAAVIPSLSKINTEILLNNLNVFNRLAALYALLGVLFLFFLLFQVFKQSANLMAIYRILFLVALAGFVFHTVGLGLRWYVSGRAPWSNGYESMIYIAWTTVLAGILFTRKSFGGLAATMILSATILLVASFSYLDPEITPLVPVLKSYWLTIHVSLEAGSYGFLMLGAIIGLINIILMVFLAEKNQHKIHRIVKEMSYISEMTLIGGLFMISIGTYLGGVWANESWGRYWGWDAKETWALVTILIYAFILHMRLIPGLKSLFAYNVSTIFGLASVIMTYYGVNYYLSGLHSYAAGDPVPIPQWVYIATTAIVVLSIIAFWRKRKFHLFK
ncbi:MAG TPA: cytochrome c biogenesis protein CcsA [Bacteroidia bacterium]|nr:cytochrome c biogenesis protein CcsA [Bacteroidia bacterium]